MGKEELLASLGLREEEEEREALLQGESTGEGSGEPGTTGEGEDGERRYLRFSSLAALLCRLSVSKSSKDEFQVFRLCTARGARSWSLCQRLLGKGLSTEGLGTYILRGTFSSQGILNLLLLRKRATFPLLL